MDTLVTYSGHTCHIQWTNRNASSYPPPTQHSKHSDLENVFTLLVYVTTILSHCLSLRMDNEPKTLLTTEPSSSACQYPALYHLPHFCAKVKQRNHQRWWKERIAKVMASCGHCTAVCLKGLKNLAKSRPRCEASTSGTHVTACSVIFGIRTTGPTQSGRRLDSPPLHDGSHRTINSRSCRIHRSVV